MVRGRSVELVLEPDQAPLPERHRVLLVEADYWDGVQYWPERNSWDGGRLGDSIMNRFVLLEREKPATIHGLGPGRFRFKVFPDDLLLEPAEVEIGEEPPEPVLVRWRRR